MEIKSCIPKFTTAQILFAGFAWSLLILRFGYRFGTGDQVELLPYTLFLHNHNLYSHDFFIQGLNASVPNERTIMAYLLLPFVNCLEIACFVFHFLVSMVLILGLERIAIRFINNKYLAWLAVLVSLVPLNDFALGNVEMYSDCLQASSVATAIVVWGLWAFLQRRYQLSSCLLSIATFIQVLEGLDVMLVLSALLLALVLIKQLPLKQFIYFTAIYACTAGLFLVWIWIGKQGVSAVSNEELFQILFLFRHPHHFIFTTFPKFKLIVFCALTFTSLIYFSRRSSRVFTFILVSLFGLIVYAFAVDDFHNIFIANFQFYKVTQWMKFLGIVAAFGLLDRCLPEKTKQWQTAAMDNIVLLSFSILCWVITIQFNRILPYKVPYELFEMKRTNDMIAICEKIKEVTPVDAVFIQPFENTELKYYAQRSSYVEFKANVRHKKFVKDWYNRIGLVYGISQTDAAKGFTLKDKADAGYYTNNLWQLSNRKGSGITHMLVDKRYKPPFGTLILENNTYAVYQL